MNNNDNIVQPCAMASLALWLTLLWAWDIYTALAVSIVDMQVCSSPKNVYCVRDREWNDCATTPWCNLFTSSSDGCGPDLSRVTLMLQPEHKETLQQSVASSQKWSKSYAVDQQFQRVNVNCKKLKKGDSSSAF